MQYVGEGELPLAVSIEEFKRSVHLYEGDAEDDGALAALIGAAQQLVFTATGRAFSPVLYEFTVAAGAWRRWWLPCAPVSSIQTVEVILTDGSTSLLTASDYRLVDGQNEPQLILTSDLDLAAETVRVVATIGHAVNAPETRTLRRAIILIAKEWMDAETAIEDQPEAARVSFQARHLIGQVRYRRPCICAEA